MTNPRIPYRFSNEGPHLKPPEQGSIIVHLVVNVENWSFEASMPRTIITPPHGKETIPDVPNFSWADYGMRAGLPRIIDAIQSRGLPASTSINASVINEYPRAAEAILQAGWEFIGHGVHQKTLNHSEGEALLIRSSLDLIAEFTGKRPKGWLSPGLRESFDTPEYLKKEGIEYVFDWVVDDIPHWMHTIHGPILAMPYNLEINDSIIFAVEKHSSNEMYQRLSNTLDLFLRESKFHPRVLAIGLHPHLIGVPHRFASFERMLDLLLNTPEVCFLTGEEIAHWYVSQVPSPTQSFFQK